MLNLVQHIQPGCCDSLFNNLAIAPALLLYQGQLKHDVLKRERVAEGEVLAALRASGIGAIENTDAVVLETDGSFSVIKDLSNSTASALKDVKECDRVPSQFC